MFKKSLHLAVVLTLAVIFSSCSTYRETHSKQTKAFIGTWNDLVNPGTYVVFNADGSFYNLSTENGVKIITHSGTNKILTDQLYVVNITEARSNARFELKGKQYANNYVLGPDKKSMKLTGVGEGKSGAQDFAWTNDLVRITSQELANAEGQQSK